jgi:hypothetical protein
LLISSISPADSYLQTPQLFDVDGKNSTISGAFSLSGFKSIPMTNPRVKKIEGSLEHGKAWDLSEVEYEGKRHPSRKFE